MYKRCFIYCSLIFTYFIIFAPPIFGDNDRPDAALFIEEVRNNVIEIKKEITCPVNKSKLKIANYISGLIYFDEIIKNVLGNYYNSISVNELLLFTKYFKVIFINTLSSYIFNYLNDNNSLKVKHPASIIELKEGDKISTFAVVNAILHRPNEDIPISFYLTLLDNKNDNKKIWKLSKYLSDNVDQLDSYKRQYGVIIKNKSFKDLLNTLKNQYNSVRDNIDWKNGND